MIKLIASDIDGTLVKEYSTELYPELYEAIMQWTDAGNYFCAASGRQYFSIRSIFGPVADRIIFLAENGAHVRYGQEDILIKKMEDEYVKKLITQLRTYYGECDAVYSSTEEGLLETKNQEFIKFFSETYKNKFRLVEDVLKENADIIKIGFYRKGGIRQLGEEVLIPAWQDKLQTCMAGEEWVDFMDASVDKGNALRVVQQHFGISREETMAFGDNDNDISLLLAAEESYAVENARDSVKTKAKHICPSYEKKGVYYVMKELLEK